MGKSFIFNLTSVEELPKRIQKKPALPKGYASKRIYDYLFEDFLASNKQVVKIIIPNNLKTCNIYYNLRRHTPENVRISVRVGEIYLERLNWRGDGEN